MKREDISKIFNCCLEKMGFVSYFYGYGKYSSGKEEQLVAFCARNSYFFDFHHENLFVTADLKNFIGFLVLFRKKFDFLFPGNSFEDVYSGFHWIKDLYSALDNSKVLIDTDWGHNLPNKLSTNMGTKILFNGLKDYLLMMFLSYSNGARKGFKVFGIRKEIDRVVSKMNSWGIYNSDMETSIYRYLTSL